MEKRFCRAANTILEERYLCCDSCPLLTFHEENGGNGSETYRENTVSPCQPAISCTYRENGKEFPDFIGIGQYDESYALFQQALQFAAEAHKGTFQKQIRVPYIMHPMEAAMITHTITKDAEVLAASALHDVIEDTAFTYEDICQGFGKRVADIVQEESENKRRHMLPEDSWMLRKEEGIRRIKNASKEGKWVALGDKLSNMRATARDYEIYGDAVFDRFHRKEKSVHEWYHRGLLDSLSELSDTPAYREYQSLYRQVFS